MSPRMRWSHAWLCSFEKAKVVCDFHAGLSIAVWWALHAYSGKKRVLLLFEFRRRNSDIRVCAKTQN